MKWKNRRARFLHGSVAYALTALVIVATVIFNVIIAALAGRYQWMYVDMNGSTVYSISDECKEYISEHVVSEVDRYNRENGENGKITLIFGDEKENLESDQTQGYIHDSVLELVELFPEYLEVEYLDIWENPSIAREYGLDATSDVACVFGGKCETVDLASFFVYGVESGSSPTAYNGEKILAACLMRVVQSKTPVCAITVNHGETFGDTELIRLIAEAGYSMKYIDLAIEDIPEDCELILTYDPKKDLIISDGVSSISERDKLDAYMSRGGKYMVFLSADSFVGGGHENLEAFLADWGVSYAHSEGKDGIEDCYLIKDSENSLSIDGYTVISRIADNVVADQAIGGSDRSNIFGNTTAIRASESFSLRGDGTYSASFGGRERIFAPILTSYEGAEAWAGGRAVERADRNGFTLMSISSQECENGETAYLLASASTVFGAEEHMQSAVLGNSRTLMSVIGFMGKENAPASLTIKPFASLEIESLAVSDANLCAVLLAAVPAVCAAVVGAVVLIRRKHS